MIHGEKFDSLIEKFPTLKKKYIPNVATNKNNITLTF